MLEYDSIFLPSLLQIGLLLCLKQEGSRSILSSLLPYCVSGARFEVCSHPVHDGGRLVALDVDAVGVDLVDLVGELTGRGTRR